MKYEFIEAPRDCPDCAAKPGFTHDSGCDVEFCSVCGGQWIGCGHKNHDPKLAFWTGFWPGKETVRLLGLKDLNELHEVIVGLKPFKGRPYPDD
jgi:hypothetical protein